MKKLLVSYATVALVGVQAVMPAAIFAETVGNIGNGVESNNSATVNSNNTTSVSQSNSAAVSNTISVNSNTGGNDANKNTGGDVNVKTGDSGAKVAIQNFANSNVANVNGCCELGGSASVTNSGNGDSSDNYAKLNKNNSTALSQTNVAEVANFVDVKSNTGKNDANKNTGGDVSVKTGDSLVGPILISNQLNSNSALVGPSNGAGVGAGSLTLGNAGNGVESDNSAVANLTNSTLASQSNFAGVLNYVDVYSNTGKNDANRNTGGEVEIDTGDSAIAVGLSTKANSNIAALAACGCVAFGDTVVKNAGNGDSAESDAVLNKTNATAVGQANLSDIANFGYFDTNTGKNEANKNTGEYGAYSDPAVETGEAYTQVGAATEANSNVLNNGFVSVTPGPLSSGNTGNGAYWSNWGWNWNAAM